MLLCHTNFQKASLSNKLSPFTVINDLCQTAENPFHFRISLLGTDVIIHKFREDKRTAFFVQLTFLRALLNTLSKVKGKNMNRFKSILNNQNNKQ